MVMFVVNVLGLPAYWECTVRIHTFTMLSYIHAGGVQSLPTAGVAETGQREEIRSGILVVVVVCE